MNKIFLIVMLLMFLILINGCKEDIPEKIYCNKDSNCIPATCCHPSSCVNINYRPDCEGLMCSMECAPETMDCGQGHCECAGNKCAVVIE